MIETLLARLRIYDDISVEEERALRAIATQQTRFARGDIIVRANVELSRSNLIVEGFAHRYKDLASGKRQSSEIGVPGDFLDLHSLLMKRIDHDVAALTDCSVVYFPHEGLLDITQTHPHLTRVLWLSTIIDAAIHREWILSLGARSSLQRTAQLFCEMKIRLDAIGVGGENGFRFPVVQENLAEILGITPVHVNRVLKELRVQQVVSCGGGEVRIKDWNRLVGIAEFDPSYLGLVHRPR